MHIDDAELGGIAGELGRLTTAVRGLVDAVGTDPTTDDPDKTGSRGTGMRGRLCELERKIGEAPDPTTGKDGSGLLKVLHEHLLAANARGRRMVGASAIGGAAVLGIIELGIELLKLVNG